MATPRSVPLPYTPDPPPEGGTLGRATWDELYRIALSMGQMDRPMAVSASCTDQLSVDPVSPTWELLFDEGLVIDWSAPEGMLEAGIFTVPGEGLYQFICVVRVNPFNTGGQRSYTLEVRTTWTHATGAADTVVVTQSGALDDQFNSLVVPALLPCFQGDSVMFEARCMQTNGTGLAPCQANLQVTRVSGVR